jgi:choice-of-anchor B domain-containing protein
MKTTPIRLLTAWALAALVAACSDGGPGGPDDPGDGIPDGELAIVWDGRTVDWGAPEILRAEIDGEPVDVEWRSLSDDYLGSPVELGRGAETTTAPLRPGTTTVEARILSGSTVAKRATADVTVRYREGWNITLLGMIPYPDGTVGDVWVVDETAFVARRHAGGISILDLDAIQEIGRFTAPDLFTQDVKAAGGVAYVSNETDLYPFAVTLLDVSDPTAPVVLGGVPTAAVGVAHNLWIDGGLLALASQATRAIHLYDVSDPAAPAALADLHATDAVAHDVHVRDDRLYGSYMALSDGQVAELTLATIADPANPVVTSRAGYPGAHLTHSSWLAADGRTLYVADEIVNAPIRIFDVSDPAAPELLGTYQPRLGTIPHNFQVRDGRFAYLAHYKHGMEVVDVSDPTRPRLVGFWDTHPGQAADVDPHGSLSVSRDLSAAHEKEGQLYEGAWGVHWTDDGRIVVSDMNRGVFLFRYTGS